MQLIKHGPDIPDELLQAQEEGRVVFFCGAGISVPAGLPTFKDLVTRIYRRLNERKTPSERRDSRNNQFEAVLEQLESRLADGHRVVRKTMFDILSLDKRKNKSPDLKTHKALLQLAGFVGGGGRMVTTNYDHCFIEASRVLNLTGLSQCSYQAPLLPIPRQERWGGLFYLHGLMPKTYGDNAMRELILTSADFGRAYLKDNWASHFVIELLRHYSVCFVGYSINDTVMRYLLDALAADTGSRQQVWAFASYKPGKQAEVRTEWETKKVQPILFESSEQFQNYRLLHETIQAWAKKQNEGNWRKEIIEQSVRLSPLESSPADDYVGRMIWALSDERGKGAEVLATLPELPSFDWVKALSEPRFTTMDLVRKGFLTDARSLNKPQFSLLRRHYPRGRGSQMALVRYPGEVSQLDWRMSGLATWISRYWDDPHLVQWVEEQGGLLDDEFAEKIREQLARADAVVGSKRNHQRLEQAVYWLQKLNGTATANGAETGGFSDWVKDFKLWGMTGSLRIRLRDLLKPWIRNRMTLDFQWSDREKRTGLWRDIEISVSEDDFEDLRDNPLWKGCQWFLLYDYEILLTDVLQLFEELGNTVDQDESVYVMPFIGDRLDDKRHDASWTLLIELLRDAWIQQTKVDKNAAVATAERWFTQPFILFKRMAFFAASHERTIPVAVWSSWLFDKDGQYLVSAVTRREVYQLLASRGQELNAREQAALQVLIKHKCQEDRDNVGAIYAQYERSGLLNSCRIGGMKLTRESQRFLDNMPEEPRDKQQRREIEPIPRELSQFKTWVKQQDQKKLTPGIWRQWDSFCRQNIDLCYTTLLVLHGEAADSVAFWRIGLSVFTVDRIGWERWAQLLVILPQLPIVALFELRQAIAWWMLTAFESIKETVCQKNTQIRKQIVSTISLLLIIGKAEVSAVRPADEPNGLLLRALLRFWTRAYHPTVNQKLPPDIKLVLDVVCADKTESWRGARENLAKDTSLLYLIDQEWVRARLLPLFNWQTNSWEAAEMWYGFLVGSRWHPTLMQEVKPAFFKFVNHLDKMPESVTPYVTLLVCMGLTVPHCYSEKELKTLFSGFTKDMQMTAIWQIENSMPQGTPEERNRYWRRVLLPFFKKIWPRNKCESDPDISQRFCSLLMKSGDEFLKVFEVFRPLLSQTKYDSLVLKNLLETKFCNDYPNDVLEYLEIVLWRPASHLDWLQECLNRIAAANPTLKKSSVFKRFEKLVR